MENFIVNDVIALTYDTGEYGKGTEAIKVASFLFCPQS